MNLNAEYDPMDREDYLEDQEPIEQTEDVLDEGTGAEEVVEDQPQGNEEPFIIRKTNEDGSVVEEQYTQEQILEALEKSRSAEPVDENIQRLAPFIEQVKNDDLMQQIMRDKAQGWTNDDIVTGLFLNKYPEFKNVNPQAYWQLVDMYQKGQLGPAAQQQQQEEKMPEFATLEEEIRYHTQKAIQKELQDIKGVVQGLQENTRKYESERQASNVLSANDRTFESAMTQLNVDRSSITQDDLARMYENMQALWPGVNAETYAFTPMQARKLMEMTFSQKTTQGGGVASQMTQQKPDTSQMVRAAKSPQVLPGAKTASPASSIKNVADSKMARSKAIDELFGFGINK